MEVTSGDKHSSLLQCEVEYDSKKFYDTGPHTLSETIPEAVFLVVCDPSMNKLWAT